MEDRMVKDQACRSVCEGVRVCTCVRVCVSQPSNEDKDDGLVTKHEHSEQGMHIGRQTIPSHLFGRVALPCVDLISGRMTR